MSEEIGAKVLAIVKANMDKWGIKADCVIRDERIEVRPSEPLTGEQRDLVNEWNRFNAMANDYHMVIVSNPGP